MSPIERPSDTSVDYRENLHHIRNQLKDHVICLNPTDDINNNNNENDSQNPNNRRHHLGNELKRQSSCSSGGSNIENYANKLRDDFPKCNRNRQLFGIQLEVTSLLLEAERRKLNVLQRELQVALEDSGSIKKAKEQLKQELILAISRIQLQYDLLEKEYKQHAIGRLRNSNTRGTGKRDNYNNTHENASDICGKLSGRPQQSHQHQNQQQQHHQNRSKPAVPAKPTNIPPVLVPQFFKDPSTPSTNVKYLTREMQRNTGYDYQTAGASKISSKCDTSVPTSPNMGFGNDCCGMLLSGSSKGHQNDAGASNSDCQHHNNNNNNNSNSNECDGGATSCINTASNKLVHSLNCGIKHSSTDSVDGCSSVSSHSGGFRDPEYINRQQIAYNLSNIKNSENCGKLIVVASSSSSSPSKKLQMPKLQFNQTTKQIEQILAQRLAISSSTSSSTLSSTSTSIVSSAAATGATPSPATVTNQTTTIVTASVVPTENSILPSIVGGVSLNKKRMFSSCYSSTDGANLIVPGVSTNQGIDSSSNLTVSLNISRHLQNKLQEEMKQQCKIIQEKHLIEKRAPQLNYKPITTEDLMSNRSQPAIGLKQTPKSRPTIFGTVASDQGPKDSVNRRGLPQTTGKGVVIEKQPNTLSPSVSADSYKEIFDADENALVYRDGNLISGPLDGLIQHMVPTGEYYPDRSYLFAFLLSARLFIRPHELLAKICQLCDEQQNISQRSSPEGQQNQTSGDHLDHHHHHHHHHHNQQHQNPDDGGFDETTNPSSDSGECCRNLRSFAQHFVQLLTEWIETFPYDFRDDRLMQHVRAMTKKCISIDTSLRKNVSTMLQNLMHRLAILDKYEEYLQSLAKGSGDCRATDLSGLIGITGTGHLNTTNQSSDQLQNVQHQNQNQQIQHTIGGLHPSAQSNSTNTSSSSLTSGNTQSSSSIDIGELCPNPTLLAHQLTHIELERLSHIGPEEFVQAFAKENPHLEQSFSDMKKTRNLESYVQWFNRLSYLVATEIVKHPKKKQRVRVVEYWIETARECFNIGNFNSLMAIIAGLNMSPISRLKKTWAKVQSAKFAVLEHQMDPSSNFNSYRSTLKAAMWRSAGATDERERIVIPFFSLLVKDLYFLNEGCSNKLPNGHINFEKFWQLAKQVTEFIAWKQVTCPFDKIQKVIMFLQTNHVLNENTLAMASFECEPPENHEKDRYKCLKSEQHHHHHNHHHQ